VPVADSLIPAWAVDIPSEAELFELLKTDLWKGTYEISIDLQPFEVYHNYGQYNHASTLVWLSMQKFDTGKLSTVLYAYVGDKTKSWPDGLWEGATLKMLSGNAAGNTYAIATNLSTDDDPPPELPPDESLLKIGYPGPSPITDGVQPGDDYEIRLPFMQNYEKMFFDKIEFPPGSYNAQTLNYSFEVE